MSAAAEKNYTEEKDAPVQSNSNFDHESLNSSNPTTKREFTDDGIVHADDYARTKFIMVRKAEILAEQYKSSYVLTGVLLFSALIIGYGYGLDANVRYVYTGYAASSYGQHSLISTIGVINAVIGAASQVVYARLSDVFGRLQLLITAIVFYVVGTIIQSQAYDIQRYCAGAVFYNLGYVGVLLIVLLILSDFSSLRWRLFFQFVPTLPYIVNTWISGNVTSAVGPLKNWSWGIGMWAFIFPLSAIPFVGCMLHMRYLASKTEEWKEIKKQKGFFKYSSGKDIFNSFAELFARVDLLGVVILTVCIGCLLVPLTLAGGLQSKWKQGEIIAPLVIGVVLLPVFGVYESKFARYPMAPFKLLKDRGVWAALAISFLFDFVYYMAYDYLYTVLVVAVNQSTASATRISSLASFVSVVWSPFFALIIVYFRKLKVFIIIGTALWLVATGLLYHYRGGEGSKNGIIGAMVVWGIGTTMFTYPVAVSVQSVTSHENMATVTALCYVLYRIGTAVGTAVSGAVWTQLLPDKIEKNLGNTTLAIEAYGDPYGFAAAYKWNTPERDAVVDAYRYIQRLETVIALCFCSLLIFFALFLRDAPLTDEQAHNEEIADGEMVYTKHEDRIYEFVRGIFNKKSRTKASSEKSNEDSE